ncbi:PD-(D/E)XK nuclease family protein [Anaeromyxobacter paludicola]|uniref:PD-(D/E)XK endonuclease-like domain-containing protein n=1 Tax=Anaeromyxobacter paludicola TaxID=2918171 RepID=A0ABM7XCQ7_9BACT|nr:PD-(D/E)XK nuclease family protein [Anaeromyxobacter paludicola]BDG09613.1 hypothetical protein AMPC_27260 [Anaeromyxobacter paludicola]
MAELTNDFSWSKSRHEKFQECRRAYYYAYYGAWGGWEAPAGSEVRELYVLKQLSSRWQWAGSLVHEALKQLLRRAQVTGQYLPADDLVARTRQRARALWSVSREKSYWRDRKPVGALVEHEYGDPVTGEEWKRLFEEVVEGSLRGFYASPAFAEIKETPRSQWLTVDELDSFQFEGTKIWVAIDFGYRGNDGLVHVLDWKTGRERGVDQTQVGIYTLYAQGKWKLAPGEVVGGLVYLGQGGETTDVRADPEALAGCEQKMRDSIAGMRALLDDAPRNRASLGRFPQAEDPAACRRCPFRRPCGRL